MTESEINTRSDEENILRAVKQVLTLVIKDTATAPGLKHPLSDDTIIYMRQCLALISTREQELDSLSGRERKLRPHYTDEPVRQAESVSVSFVDFKKK